MESFETVRTPQTPHLEIPDARNFAAHNAALKVGPAPMKYRPKCLASSENRADHAESVISIAKNGAEKRQSIRSQNPARKRDIFKTARVQPVRSRLT